VKFSGHQIGRLERLFGETFPDAMPSEEDLQYHRERVREAMRHPSPDQAALFRLEPGGVFHRGDGREIVNTVQMFAEELYAEELEGPSEFDHDEEAEAFYHREYGDLVVDRYTYNLSLLNGGHRRGIYANPYAVKPDEHRGGGGDCFQ
jgi:hypothetical protein